MNREENDASHGRKSLCKSPVAGETQGTEGTGSVSRKGESVL